MSASGQASFFDTNTSGRATLGDEAQAAHGRARMRAMIDRLRATDVPPWRDQMGVILDDGAFQRAMRLVPDAEARAAWAEFDAQMERLYAIWAAAQGQPD